MKSNILKGLVTFSILTFGALADPGTAFTYQGRVTNNGTPITGTISLRFSLYNQLSGGTQIGSTQTFATVTATNGLFTQAIDFGTVMDGSTRFLAIEVDGDGGANSFTLLTPRRSLAPVPYAVYAENSTPWALDASDGTPARTLLANNAGEVTAGATGYTVGKTGRLQLSENKLELAVRPTTTIIALEGVSGSAFSSTGFWQSFTATSNSTLASIDIMRGSGAADAVVSLFAGTGTGGQLLAETNVPPYDFFPGTWQTATFPTDIPLTNGSVYTFRITSATTFIVRATSTPYSGGSFEGSAGDLMFRVRTLSDTNFVSALAVDSTTAKVGIGVPPSAYNLSTGSASFGSGNVTVQSTGVTMAAGTTLDANGTADFDGNVKMGMHALTYDAVNERIGIHNDFPSQPFDVQNDAVFGVNALFVDTFLNRVGVGTSTPGQPLDVVGNARFDATTFFVDAANNRVGAGTATPATTLHATKSFDGSAQIPAENVAFFENTNTGISPDVLLLKVGATGNPGVGSNFITFIDGDITPTLGSIQGNGAGGVELAAPGNDYAEWLPRLDVNEKLEPGDVVGIFAGRITKRTDGADAIMVISSNPIVTGNSPGDEAVVPSGDRVAFVGQAKIKVRGPVQLGDYVVASGQDDGTAVAVSPQLISPAQAMLSLGRAWENSTEMGLKKVNALVGIMQAPGLVAATSRENEELRARVDEMSQRLAAVEKLLGQPQLANSH